MKLTKVPKFISPYGSVEFLPVEDVAGHSHRMVVNGQASKIWISLESKLDIKTVTFFVRLWGALRDGLPKYHYADQRIDPPVLA